MDAAQQRRDASLSMLENAILLLEGQELQGERTRLNEAKERLGRLVDAAAAPTRDDNDDADSPRAEAAAGVGHKDVDAQTSKVGPEPRPGRQHPRRGETRPVHGPARI